MNGHKKRSLIITLLVVGLVVITSGGYFLYHYSLVTPPLHNKQPAFTGSQTAANLTAGLSSQAAAPLSVQGGAVATPQVSSATTTPAPQPVAASGTAGFSKVSALSSPQNGPATAMPPPGVARNLQNTVTDILNLPAQL